MSSSDLYLPSDQAVQNAILLLTRKGATTTPKLAPEIWSAICPTPSYSCCWWNLRQQSTHVSNVIDGFTQQACAMSLTILCHAFHTLYSLIWRNTKFQNYRRHNSASVSQNSTCSHKMMFLRSKLWPARNLELKMLHEYSRNTTQKKILGTGNEAQL